LSPTMCTAQAPFTPPFPTTASLLAACDYPAPFPACGGTNITVGRGQTIILPPGVYGNVTVEGAPLPGKLILDGTGEYRMCNLAVGRRADVFFRSAVPGRVDLFVEQDISELGIDPKVAPGGTFGPEPGSALMAADVNVFTGGRRVRFSRDAHVQAIIC